MKSRQLSSDEIKVLIALQFADVSESEIESLVNCTFQETPPTVTAPKLDRVSA